MSAPAPKDSYHVDNNASYLTTSRTPYVTSRSNEAKAKQRIKTFTKVNPEEIKRKIEET